MLLDVFGRRFNAHVRQPGALEVESAKLCTVHLERNRFTVAVDALLRLSRFFAPPLRVLKHLASRRLNRLARRIWSINNTRIRFQAVARPHNVNYAIIP